MLIVKPVNMPGFFLFVITEVIHGTALSAKPGKILD